MPKASTNTHERMSALEQGMHSMHDMMATLTRTLNGGARPTTGVVDANGVPYVSSPLPDPATNERAVTAVATSDSTTNLLAVLLPFLRQQVPPPPPPSPWAGLVEVLAPILIEKLLDRPDPLEQFAKIQELITPGMSDQVMAATLPALMPALVAKLTGETDGKKGEEGSKGDLADAFKKALGGLDPADLLKLAASQAEADGGDSTP